MKQRFFNRISKIILIALFLTSSNAYCTKLRATKQQNENTGASTSSGKMGSTETVSSVKEIADSADFMKEVLNNKGTVIVKFYAPWCPACKAVAPLYTSAANQNKKIKFVEINIDKNMPLAEKYGVEGIPYFTTFKKGKKVMSKKGFDENTIKELIG